MNSQFGSLFKWHVKWLFMDTIQNFQNNFLVFSIVFSTNGETLTAKKWAFKILLNLWLVVCLNLFLIYFKHVFSRSQILLSSYSPPVFAVYSLPLVGSGLECFTLKENPCSLWLLNTQCLTGTCLLFSIKIYFNVIIKCN